MASWALEPVVPLAEVTDDEAHDRAKERSRPAGPPPARARRFFIIIFLEVYLTAKIVVHWSTVLPLPGA